MTNKQPTDEWQLDDVSVEILRGMDPVIPRSDVTIHADEAISEDLHEAVLAVLGQHPELWFIEAKTKDERRRLAAQGRHISLVHTQPSEPSKYEPFDFDAELSAEPSHLNEYRIPLPVEAEDVSSLPYHHPYFESDEYLRSLLDPKRLKTTDQIAGHFEKISSTIHEMSAELGNTHMEVGELYSHEFGGVYDFAYLLDQPEVVRVQAKIAFSEVEEAYAKLSAAKDRFRLIAKKCHQPESCGDTSEAADWIDAKHGLAHKRLKLEVHWYGEKNGFTILFEEPDAEGSDAYALHLLFSSLFFEWNGERDCPCWSFGVQPPSGTIERLREGLDRLGRINSRLRLRGGDD